LGGKEGTHGTRGKPNLETGVWGGEMGAKSVNGSKSWAKKGSILTDLASGTGKKQTGGPDPIFLGRLQQDDWEGRGRDETDWAG